MSRKHSEPEPAAKPWVHLVDDAEKPFDQTNGIVDFDREPEPGPSEIEQALWRTGQANIVMH